MALIKSFHSLTLILFTLYGLLAAQSLQGDALIYWMVWSVYALLLCGLMLDNIWCARLLVFPPLLIVTCTVPLVLYNVYAFVSVNPLYQDSPATIIVVAILALSVTVPSACVLGAYWNQRHPLFGSNAER